MHYFSITNKSPAVIAPIGGGCHGETTLQLAIAVAIHNSNNSVCPGMIFHN